MEKVEVGWFDQYVAKPIEWALKPEFFGIPNIYMIASAILVLIVVLATLTTRRNKRRQRERNRQSYAESYDTTYDGDLE